MEWTIFFSLFAQESVLWLLQLSAKDLLQKTPSFMSGTHQGTEGNWSDPIHWVTVVNNVLAVRIVC